MIRGDEDKCQHYQNLGKRSNHLVNENMQRIALPTSNYTAESHSPPPDLLWISRQQQQHPLTHLHPLKNTIRVNSNGVRYKFDGKQWRPLCESNDGHECRNLSFRSSLCQKHFYKMHLYKRPYTKAGSKPLLSAISDVTSTSLKRQLSNPYEYQYSHNQHEQHVMYNNNDEEEEEEEDQNSIQYLENQETLMVQREKIEPKVVVQPEMNFFTIGGDTHHDCRKYEIHHLKSAPIPPNKRLHLTNTDPIISNESVHSSRNLPQPKPNECLRPGVLSLTRTEEKSLANELITQLSVDISVIIAEQWTCRRAREIMLDNYSYQFSTIEIPSDWFYDFLLRNPRVPIHFQSWFGSIQPTIPTSDVLIDIKIWELGLITRSILPSSAISSSSCSP